MDNTQLTTQVQVSALSGGLKIQTMDDLARLGNMLAKCKYFDDAKYAAQAGVKVLAGLELGIPAMAAMTGISIVKGRPVMSANLMAACVKRNEKYNYRIKKHTTQECVIEFMENGESVGTSSYTMEEAKKAGLTSKDNWKNYPKNMLFARALSNGVKWYASDIFLGAPVYTEDELSDTPLQQPTPTIELPNTVIDEIEVMDEDVDPVHDIEQHLQQENTTTETPDQSLSDEDPRCPQCGGAMWDCRTLEDGGKGVYPKTNPAAPDWRCQKKCLRGVIWPAKKEEEYDKLFHGGLVENDVPPITDDEIQF